MPLHTASSPQHQDPYFKIVAAWHLKKKTKYKKQLTFDLPSLFAWEFIFNLGQHVD